MDSRCFGGPLPEMPPAPPQRGSSPGENFGGPLGKNRWANLVGAAAFGGGHIWYQRFFRGVSRILHRGWCFAEGVPGAFPEGVPQTPGICEEGSPMTGLSRRVSTP
jgi:hypothetical protein